VVFDSLSNATAYTVTATATQLRCAALTMAGPLTGNVTWAGTAPLAIHGDVTLPASGLTRTYTGAITLTGSSTGRTLTTNGVALASATTVDGVGCGWTLGSAIDFGNNLTITNGTFDTGNYSVIALLFSSTNSNTRTISFGSSTIGLGVGSSGSHINFANPINLIFNCGTSLITVGPTNSTFAGGSQIFYNVSFNAIVATTTTISGVNTFNNLSSAGITSAGLKIISLSANQTINGTLTLSAGTDATMRTFVQSNTIGTTRTLTCAAFSGTDVDFRDITIAGAAAPASGTRLGDCKGNSGITFDAAKTVYRVGAGANWSSNNNWSNSSGGTGNDIYFPLAQDIAVFDNNSGATGMTKNLNANYNVGTIDMSGRTSNTMTLATGTTTPGIYGNWINGTGTTMTGTGVLTFAGRGSQTITSAGRSFTQPITINSPSGSITLQDALNLTGNNIVLTSGTIDAISYNVTVGSLTATGSLQRTLAFGSGTWTFINATSPFNASGATNLTLTGTGTINLTSSTSKSFAGGGFSYSGITLNQGGAGALTITGNNTFANVTNTSGVGTIINFGATSTTLLQFTATGTAGNPLTINGTSAASPATLIYTGGGNVNVGYLTINNVRGYPL
jgi:hypothetical protein